MAKGSLQKKKKNVTNVTFGGGAVWQCQLVINQGFATVATAFAAEKKHSFVSPGKPDIWLSLLKNWKIMIRFKKKV